MGITDDTINPYYMSYDMARDALPTIGYNQRDEVVDTNTLRINLAISENEMGGRYTPENDDHIKKQLMDNMMLELYSKGYFNLWALILFRNKASLKSFSEFGFENIGSYKYLKLPFLSFLFPPNKMRS